MNYNINNLGLLEVFIILKEYSRYNYLVGGCVRDLLLNKEPKDYDIVTDTSFDILKEVFSYNGWNTIESGVVFGVLNITKTIGSNYYEFEIANFRKDGIYSNNRQPDTIEKLEITSNETLLTDIYEDAVRRDFTVNSLYFDVWTYEILDPTGKGLNDLNNNLLKFNLNPEDRIKEDNLRVFRYLRFIAKGFKGDTNTLNIIKDMFVDIIDNIEIERIRIELEKMCRSELLNHSDNFILTNNIQDNFLFYTDEINERFCLINHNKEILKQENFPLSLIEFYMKVYKGYKPSVRTIKFIRQHFKEYFKKIKNKDTIFHRILIDIVFNREELK